MWSNKGKPREAKVAAEDESSSIVRNIGEQVDLIEAKSLEMKTVSKQLEDRLSSLQSTLVDYLAKAASHQK